MRMTGDKCSASDPFVIWMSFCYHTDKMYILDHMACFGIQVKHFVQKDLFPKGSDIYYCSFIVLLIFVTAF